MRAHAAKHDFFFAQLAQLQQRWTLRRPQLGSGAAGPFQIDVALPLGPKWQLRRDEQQPYAIVDIAEGPDGTLQLLSGGLPVPDVPLRWLRPLHRPSPASSKHAPQQQQHVSAAEVLANADKQPQHAQSSSPAQEATPTDIVMSEAGPSPLQRQPVSAEASQAVATAHDAEPPVQQDAHESIAMAIDNQSEADQGSATLHNADAKLGVQPMQQLQQQPELDKQQQLGQSQLPLQAPQLQQGQLQMPPGQAPQLQLGQLQMPSGQYHLPELPPGLQEKVHEHVVRCDRQLLGRQEALMARWLPQRIEEAVRAKHGAADIDDSATGFVRQAFSTTSDSNPVLAAVQLRLLQFLLHSNEAGATDCLLDEVLHLSGQQTQQP